MLSLLKEKASSVVSFLGNFVRDENSQVTKVGVLQVASVLGILSVMVLPQMAAASGWCDYCYYSGMPCNPSACDGPHTCPNNPNCAYSTMPCSGGDYYIKVCYGSTVICNSWCPTQ